jgi:hypothetical protein
VSTGSSGTPAPYPRPWATAQAVRRPVNDPGPAPKTIASSSRSVSPACASSASAAGINVLEAIAPPGPSWVRTWTRPSSSQLTAIERCSVLVSKARSFMGRLI